MRELQEFIPPSIYIYQNGNRTKFTTIQIIYNYFFFLQCMTLLEDENQTLEDCSIEENQQMLIESEYNLFILFYQMRIYKLEFNIFF